MVIVGIECDNCNKQLGIVHLDKFDLREATGGRVLCRTCKANETPEEAARAQANCDYIGQD